MTPLRTRSFWPPWASVSPAQGAFKDVGVGAAGGILAEVAKALAGVRF
jgi:hypothetical protein